MFLLYTHVVFAAFALLAFGCKSDLLDCLIGSSAVICLFDCYAAIVITCTITIAVVLLLCCCCVAVAVATTVDV